MTSIKNKESNTPNIDSIIPTIEKVINNDIIGL